MKKTVVWVVALVLSLIGNTWLAVQLNTVNNRAVTAMASVAAAEQTATTQGAELSELTQKLSDAEAKTQAVQAELDNLTALQAEQKTNVEAQQAEQKEKVKQQQEAAQKAEEEKLQNQTDPGATTPDKPAGGGGNQGGNGGGIKEPAGGIGSTPAGNMVGSSITEVGEWNPEMGAWWATTSSGKTGWLFPGGGFEQG